MSAIVRYTVTVTLPDQATAEHWLAWLRDGHIGDVLAGGATSAEIVKLDGQDFAYAIEYRFPSREVFSRYEREHAPRLRAEGLRLFPVESGVRYLRTVGEVAGSW